MPISGASSYADDLQVAILENLALEYFKSRSKFESKQIFLDYIGIRLQYVHNYDRNTHLQQSIIGTLRLLRFLKPMLSI